MNSYQIKIVEPTAVGLLEEMARKNLITLSPIEPKERFKSLLSRLRNSSSAPNSEEIINEIESVRSERLSRRHED